MTNEQKLLNLIENDEHVKRYRKLETIINNNPTILKALQQLKKQQQALVNAKYLKKTNLIQQLENDYQTLLNSFNEFPLVTEYLELQAYCNQLIATIQNIIETTINEKLERES